MADYRLYDLHGLCRVACDVESVVGRSVDLHLSHFGSPVTHTTQADGTPCADIVFHSRWPAPNVDHTITLEGLITDDTTVFIKEHHLAVRYTDRRIDVYSHRGVSPHLFLQLFGFTRGFSLVHAAGISFRGQGILLPAWGGVGKTSLVMRTMRRDDVKLLGDDFLFLCGDGGAKSYPIPFSVYQYHRELFPDLFATRHGRRGIRSLPLLSMLHALRPIAIPLLAATPRLEEVAKRFGRGYRPVPVREVFDDGKIEASAPIRTVVSLVRYSGSDFILRDQDKETAIRNLLGVVHHEFGCATLLKDLLILGACGRFNLADYFARIGETISGALSQATCREILIPATARPLEIGEFFESTVLSGLE